MSLTYRDIISRQNSIITESYRPTTGLNIKYIYENLENNYSYNNAKIVLENWQELASTDIIRLDKVLEVFSLITERDNISNIKNAASIIEGKIIKKIRDAKATRHLNNYKLGKLKIQNTKVLNHTKDNETANARARANKGYLGNSLHPHRKYPRDIYGNKMEPAKNNNKEEDNTDKEKQDTVKECVERFIALSESNDQCDRVISNHNKISKRYNFESMIRSCPLNEEAIENCIYKICSFIESYDLPFEVIYNVCLENTMFLMNKNCMNVSNSFIVEAVTNYFTMKDITQEQIEDMSYVIEHSKFFSDEDLEPVSYLILDEEEIINDLEEEDIFFEMMCIQEEGEAKPLIDWTKKKAHEKHEKNKARVEKFAKFLRFKKKEKNHTTEKKSIIDKMKIRKAIHDFKKSHKKTIEGAKTCISRIFVNSPEGIIKGLPDIFKYLRLLVVIGTFSINPILGLITAVTGYFLKMKVSRERMAEVVAYYENERDMYKKKMNEATDDKKKEKYEALYKQYKKDAETLRLYEDELYTEKEQEKREEERWAKEFENSDDEDDFNFNWDDDDFNFDFEEQAAINSVTNIANIMECMNYNTNDIMYTIKQNIEKLDSNDIYNLTECIELCNDIFDCPKYIHILELALEHERSKDNKSYMKIDAIKNSIETIENIKYNSLLDESNISFVDENGNPYIDIAYEVIKDKHNIVNDTLEFLSSKNNSLLEGKGMSFTSKLTIAKENLKRNMNMLKDKDKQLSMKLDSELDRTRKSAERAMISNSREQIIKGSFLPSASKSIHLAIASGAAYLISPALAVIGLIGAIGTSRKLNNRERNLILDDIDIEIKMCDKYIKIAEDKDDLVAVREIMKAKRDLERQRSRILYNKKYVFKGKKQYDYKPDSMKNKDDE